MTGNSVRVALQDSLVLCPIQDLFELLGKAVEGAKSLNDDKIAEYLRQNTIPTIMGPVKFGKNGEWAESRALMVQFRDLKANDVEQLKKAGSRVVLYPPSVKSGEIAFPYRD